MVLVWCLFKAQGVSDLRGQISLHGRNRGCRTTPTHITLESPLTGAPLGKGIFYPIC